jgi:hypothetical protein
VIDVLTAQEISFAEDREGERRGKEGKKKARGRE